MANSEDRGKKSADIELLTWWFVRNYYENTESYVPPALKQLIRNFSMKVFESKFLSIKLDLDLIKVLSKQLTFKDATLLYEPSNHEYKSSKFHELCDEKGETLTLIKSEFGNLFGGYTNTPWSNIDLNISDSGNTFLFLLSSNNEQQECPKIWKSKGEYGVCHWKGCGPIFGWHELKIKKNKCEIWCSGPLSGFDPKLTNDDLDEMSGAEKAEKTHCDSFLVDYEVFKMN